MFQPTIKLHVCVIFDFIASGMAAFKTKTRSNTMKPIFGEAFAFQV
eukprot:COSAG06_NODE_167_length_21546_cov_35.001352_22_plen_46_part_00